MMSSNVLYAIKNLIELKGFATIKEIKDYTDIPYSVVVRILLKNRANIRFDDGVIVQELSYQNALKRDKANGLVYEIRHFETVDGGIQILEFEGHKEFRELRQELVDNSKKCNALAWGLSPTSYVVPYKKENVEFLESEGVVELKDYNPKTEQLSWEILT